MSWVLQTVLEVRETRSFDKKYNLLLAKDTRHFYSISTYFVFSNTNHVINVILCVVSEVLLEWPTVCAFVYCISLLKLTSQAHTHMHTQSHFQQGCRGCRLHNTAVDSYEREWELAGQICLGVTSLICWNFLSEELFAYHCSFMWHQSKKNTLNCNY